LWVFKINEDSPMKTRIKVDGELSEMKVFPFMADDENVPMLRNTLIVGLKSRLEKLVGPIEQKREVNEVPFRDAIRGLLGDLDRAIAAMQERHSKVLA
jgi:hypothetical protein